MSARLKRLAIRMFAWLIGDDLAKSNQIRTLAAERDAVTEAPTTIDETAKRLDDGSFGCASPGKFPRSRLPELIAACAAAGPQPASLCPEPKLYTVDEEARAARELVALPEGSVLAEMIVDYGRERAELRACRRGF